MENKRQSPEPDFIFVGGCERSGTSLLQKVLVSHSQIAGGPEFMFTKDIIGLHWRMIAPYPDSYADRRDTYFDSDDLGDRFRTFYAGFFESQLEAKPQARYISEKTPSNIAVARYLLDLFPRSLFIHILRDGRDVVASIDRVRRRFESAGDAGFNPKTFGLFSVAGRWNQAVDEHFRALNSKETADRYFWLRFEDLVAAPSTELQRLFAFLGLDLGDRQLHPESVRSAEMGLAVDGFWTTEASDQMAFNPERVGVWRRDLGLLRRRLATFLMGSNLKRLDYLG